MSDTTDEDTPTPEGEVFDEERAKAKIAKANSEAANLRKRLKEAEEKAARLDEIEASQKSEADRIAERLAAAETRATEAESRLLRAEVAAAKGLNPAQAKRLVGTTQEELEADADEILEAFPVAGSTPPPDRRPSPDLRGGGDPTATEDPDIRAVVEAIPR